MLLVGLVAALVVFVVCAWSGRTLARHHQDRWEVAAVVAMGTCVLVALSLGRGLLDSGGTPAMLALAVVAGGGLLIGYDRADRSH